MRFNSGFKGLIGMARHSDMQKIRVIGFFFFEIWQYELGEKILQTAIFGYIFI